MGLRSIYTPQMVIDGRSEGVGSRPPTIERLLVEAASAQAPGVDITLSSSGDKASIASAAPGSKPARGDVLLAVFDGRHETPVKRGENSGRTLSNWNAVRRIERLGEWTGAALSLDLPLTETDRREGRGIAVLLQSADQGPYLGATQLAPRRAAG